jgi:hypothetical protein
MEAVSVPESPQGTESCSERNPLARGGEPRAAVPEKFQRKDLLGLGDMQTLRSEYEYLKRRTAR